MKLYLCFLWHMHQPYYKDPDTGTYILPWVRLHAVKDYATLPRIFRNHPTVHHTFNLVPSLLIQVQDYVENGAQDVYLALSRRNALDLNREEEEFLLRNFFSAHPPTMIFPQPRYEELFRRKDDALRALEKPGGVGRFGASEYTDLMTLFNLVWLHPLHREEDPELSRLFRKRSGYTEREKAYVLDRQIEIMATVLTEYRKVAATDGGELSSTPMYHPILPLLVDSRAAQDALPGAPLPRILFSYPGDAAAQLTRGREVFRSFFGAYPEGLWPSEGSISPAALELAARAGYRWAATDEILLARVLGQSVARDSEGVPVDPSWPYLPYVASTPAGPLHLFFRDHHLSDLIGFEYSRWAATDAASHFVQTIGNIYRKLAALPGPRRKEAYVVPVILDGENAWEYFPDSGQDFLDSLLAGLAALSPEISCTTFSRALEKAAVGEPLPSIPTGSWIDGTFNIWIGHQEDQAAWELLARARALWKLRADRARSEGRAPESGLDDAYEHLLVAEGSDWCWWYGDDHFTPHGAEFDRLFRGQVKAAYRALEEVPPDSIDIPILHAGKIPADQNHLAMPRGYIRPTIDGKATSYYEWSGATRYFPRPEFGSMHRATSGILECMHFGFDESTLYLRFDLSRSIFSSPGPLEMEIFFPQVNRKISMGLSPSGPSVRGTIGNIGEILLSEAGGTSPGTLRVAFESVLEVGAPLREIGHEQRERIEFFVTIVRPGAVGERWPLYGNFLADLPGKHFEAQMWEV